MKKNLISGITISGQLTLANYLVIIKELNRLAKEYNIFLFIADLHAITTKHHPNELVKLKFQTAVDYISSEVPATIFIQSEVPQHALLAFILSCHTAIGELKRMTQFKEKRTDQSTPSALMNYPLLMAADILLYQADVLVGPDQYQHLELTKAIARRINAKFGDIFYIPKIIKTEATKSRIRNLIEPQKKMSKSEKNVNGIIFLSDSPDVIIKKFRSAVTDSENRIFFDFTNKPGVSNLILIYALTLGVSIEVATTILIKNCPNYLVLKTWVAEAVIKMFAPIAKKRITLTANPKKVAQILQNGKKKAIKFATPQLLKLKKLGFNLID